MELQKVQHGFVRPPDRHHLDVALGDSGEDDGTGLMVNLMILGGLFHP